MKFQGGFKQEGVSKKGALREFEGCFKGILKMLKSKKFQACFKEVSINF